MREERVSDRYSAETEYKALGWVVNKTDNKGGTRKVEYR